MGMDGRSLAWLPGKKFLGLTGLCKTKITKKSPNPATDQSLSRHPAAPSSAQVTKISKHRPQEITTPMRYEDLVRELH